MTPGGGSGGDRGRLPRLTRAAFLPGAVGRGP